jgi:type I restriction enzyme S subunit
MNQLGKPHGALGVSLHEGIISPAYFVATISPSVDARFLHHLLRTRLYISEYERRGKYMPPNQFDISWDQFRQIELLLPPHADQRAIADFLDRETARIDLLITKKQRMIDLLAQRWAASRHEAVLRGVNPITGVGILPLGWDCPQLGVAVKLQRGHDLPFESRREGSVPVVSSGGVLGYHDQSACQGPAVVTGRYGTVGEVYFIEEDCWPLNTTLYVKDFCGNHPRWVAYLLESIPLDAESEKSAVGGINRNVIGKLWVPRPPVDEQVMIANSLLREQSKYSAARDLLVAQQDLLRERRQALITATVTGEFEVPGVAA